MSTEPRPKGITETSVLMSLTNALGWLTVDWSKPNAAVVFVLFTGFIVAGYVVIWFYWKGHNWARILVLLTSLLCLYNLRYFLRSGTVQQVMIGSEAILAIFLLFWLNKKPVKSFFGVSPATQVRLESD
jgi:hypothetical protein